MEWMIKTKHNQSNGSMCTKYMLMPVTKGEEHHCFSVGERDSNEHEKNAVPAQRLQGTSIITFRQKRGAGIALQRMAALEYAWRGSNSHHILLEEGSKG